MQCLNSAIALSPSDPEVHERTIQFRHTVAPLLASLPDATSEILQSEFPSLTSSSVSDLHAFNDAFLKAHADSPRHVHAGLSARRLLGGDQLEACEKELAAVVRMEALELEDAVRVLQTLKGWDSSEASGFAEAARGRWPEASQFG